jgi:hypothetical protein
MLVYGEEKAIGQYLARRFPELPVGYKPAFAIAWVVKIDDHLDCTGALGLVFPYPWEAAVCFWAEEGWRPRLGEIREIAETIFWKIKVKRLTAEIAKNNRRARKAAERLGFELEGVKRYGHNGRVDECIYGMAFDRCRWLRGGFHAQEQAA